MWCTAGRRARTRLVENYKRERDVCRLRVCCYTLSTYLRLAPGHRHAGSLSSARLFRHTSKSPNHVGSFCLIIPPTVQKCGCLHPMAPPFRSSCYPLRRTKRISCRPRIALRTKGTYFGWSLTGTGLIIDRDLGAPVHRSKAAASFAGCGEKPEEAWGRRCGRRGRCVLRVHCC